MKLLSEYMSDNEKRTAKVFYESKELYTVITKDDMGNHYRTSFLNMQKAEDYAEDWVL